jgi:hypothetical protein
MPAEPISTATTNSGYGYGCWGFCLITHVQTHDQKGLFSRISVHFKRINEPDVFEGSTRVSLSR